MPKPPVPADVAEFLARPNYATISVVRPDGQPISYPTWYLFEDGQIVVNTDDGRKRIEHLRRDPRVSLSAMDPHDWVTHVSIVGHVAEWIADTNLVDIDRISTHYGGEPYGNRNRPRLRPDRDRPVARLGPVQAGWLRASVSWRRRGRGWGRCLNPSAASPWPGVRPTPA